MHKRPANLLATLASMIMPATHELPAVPLTTAGYVPPGRGHNQATPKHRNKPTKKRRSKKAYQPAHPPTAKLRMSWGKCS